MTPRSSKRIIDQVDCRLARESSFRFLVSKPETGNQKLIFKGLPSEVRRLPSDYFGTILSTLPA